jgi:hypothetical protein
MCAELSALVSGEGVVVETSALALAASPPKLGDVGILLLCMPLLAGAGAVEGAVAEADTLDGDDIAQCGVQSTNDSKCGTFSSVAPAARVENLRAMLEERNAAAYEPSAIGLAAGKPKTRRVARAAVPKEECAIVSTRSLAGPRGALDDLGKTSAAATLLIRRAHSPRPASRGNGRRVDAELGRA